MIPLAVHSYYSLMQGTCPPAALCRAAKAYGYSRLALADLDNLYGLWPFLAACREEDLTPLVGATVTEPGTGRQTVCLVKDPEGYRNLCLLLTARHTATGFDLGRAATAHGAGLVLLAADPKLLSLWAGQGLDVAAALSGLPAASQKLHRQARRLGVPAAAVPASYFLAPEDHRIHCLLRAIAGRTSLSRLPAGECLPPGARLPAPSEFLRRFHLWPEAIENTQVIADRCRFTGPDFGTVLPPYERADGRAAPDVLREEAFAGAGRRYGLPLPEKVTARLEHELAIIVAKGFASYFLVVQSIIRRYPRICGRGSGAASLVAYSLGITNVCPVKHDLYFERFLNPGRSDPPDIDIDFAWDERDEVLAAVLAEYGTRAAMVSSHIPFQPRMALRETARAYGLPEAEIGRVTRRLPWLRHAFEEDGDLPAHLAALPELRGADLADPWPEIIRLAAGLVGIPRHLSVHPGGVVITPRPIAEYVPVERAPKGVPIIQWEKDGAEEAGLVKIDLLGNRSLGVIRDAIANLRANGCQLDESRWEPEDDPATQETVAAGRTMGCFYIESPAIRLLQQRAKRGDFEHLVIHSSIIRPAANDFIREYLRRLHGGAWQPLHPLLAEVLAETYGIMVYQEDVSKTAVALAGFSHAEADGLRKVLSKKDRARRLRDYREQFFAGTKERGIGPEETEALWQMMMSFDGYSFCKPHSASYARVSFQAAYLKTHFPAELMAAVISNQGGYYRASAYVSEARRLGLVIMPPDVNASGIHWHGKGRELRVGLMAVRDLGRGTQEKIVEEGRRKEFRSLADFFRRVRPDEEEGRSLILAGALDGLHPGWDRTALLWEAARWQKREREAGTALFDEPVPEPPPLPATPPRERYRRELRVLGFLCDRHPITLCRSGAAAHMVKAADLHRNRHRQVRLAGWLVTGKTVSTKKGEPMEFLTFEDETGLVETTFFPRVYQRCCHLLEADRPFLLTGKIDEEFGALTLTVSDARRL